MFKMLPFTKRLIPTLCLSFALFSCDKIDELTKFTITDEFETTIPAGPATLLPADIETPPISTNAEKELANNNSRIDMIESVKMKNMQFYLFNPEGRRFDFLRDVELFISADGLPERKIAFASNIPDSVTNLLLLTCEEVELEQYIKKGTYRIRLSVTTDKILNEDIKLRISSKYRVDARVFGV